MTKAEATAEQRLFAVIESQQAFLTQAERRWFRLVALAFLAGASVGAAATLALDQERTEAPQQAEEPQSDRGFEPRPR